MRNFFLSDTEIQAMIQETKQMPISFGAFLAGMKPKQGREGSFLQTSSKFDRLNGDGEWLMYACKSKENAFDFSCGLWFIPEGKAGRFCLVRYNGKSHWHTNHIERQQPFYDFHIHQATERYQHSRWKESHYAKPTSRYADFHTAMKCLEHDCVLQETSDNTDQIELFK